MSADSDNSPSSSPPLAAKAEAATAPAQLKVPRAPQPNEDEYRAKLDKANQEVEACQKKMVRCEAMPCFFFFFFPCRCVKLSCG